MWYSESIWNCGGIRNCVGDYLRNFVAMFTENKMDAGFFGQSGIQLERINSQEYNGYTHRDSLTLYSVSYLNNCHWNGNCFNC